MMETVSCSGNPQRIGNGGSPVRVHASEYHSGVAILKDEHIS